jgi:circadian clock protein KaiC
MTHADLESVGGQVASPLPKSPRGLSALTRSPGLGCRRGSRAWCVARRGGKSLFVLQFLVNGATQFAEPGVFLTFEEPG